MSTEFRLDARPHASRVLADPESIVKANKRAFATDPNLVDLEQLPARLSAEAVREMITAVSKPCTSELFYADGARLTGADYERYTAMLALDDIPDRVALRFALVVSRSNMRTYPTQDRVFNTAQRSDLDRFQENGLFPSDAVAVLHASSDGEWFFAQSFNYAAWVRKKRIAIGARAAVLEYEKAPRFLLVTGDKINTAYNPVIPELSELQLEMGVRVPLAESTKGQNSNNGQNPCAGHTVLLPTRTRDGGLEIRAALIPRSRDVHIGYLPYTGENITRQAFKFLGERYGWGHSYNARDCTGFVAEIYKTFGIYLPRNSAQQGASSIGRNIRFSPEDSNLKKLRAIESLETGDLIYIPGHVMMFIGTVNGAPYVIHDVSGLSYTDENGSYNEGVLNGVSVTPLLPLHLSMESTYVDKMYAIKQIR